MSVDVPDHELQVDYDHIVSNQEVFRAIKIAFAGPSVADVLESDKRDLEGKPVGTFLNIHDDYFLRKASIGGKTAYRLLLKEPPIKEVTVFYPPDEDNPGWRLEIFDTSDEMRNDIVTKVDLNLFIQKSGIYTPPASPARAGTRRSHRNSGQVGARVSSRGRGAPPSIHGVPRRQSRASRRHAQRQRRTNRVLPTSRRSRRTLLV